MSRPRPPKLMLYAPGMRLLEPDGIPSDLATRGWLYRNPNLAERVGPDGMMDAWIDTRTKIRCGRQWYNLWSGYCNRPLRRSITNYLYPWKMMKAVECDESRGPLSGEWEGQTGAPQFSDWTHEVRQKRHVWYRRAADGRPMVVVQAPAEYGHAPLRYKAAVGDALVTREDGRSLFDTPHEAIYATMAEVGLDCYRTHDEVFDALLQ